MGVADGFIGTGASGGEGCRGQWRRLRGENHWVLHQSGQKCLQAPPTKEALSEAREETSALGLR